MLMPFVWYEPSKEKFIIFAHIYYIWYSLGSYGPGITVLKHEIDSREMLSYGEVVVKTLIYFEM